MKNRKYSIGVIGLGARAETFTKQLYNGENDKVELFGVCDIDQDRMNKYLAYCEHENVKTFTDPEEFMNQPEMDAVMITTPDFTHLEVARIAFEAKKHAYLEKPLDVSAERCREIMQLHADSDVVAYVGFNLRANQAREKVKELLEATTIGQIVHIEGLEQLSQPHSASFMRRFHRKHDQSGGLLNTKCSHDMDTLQWLIGHEHKVAKVASFGGVSVFDPQKAPAKYCHECPREIFSECPYKDKAGFVFPVGGDDPIHKTVDLETYGGDLCVYNTENELIDNQTIIMEWDNGIRGNFNLQLFQSQGKREMKIWGEKGLIEMGIGGKQLVVTFSNSGERVEYDFPARAGGHGGTDPSMMGRFIDAIENGGESDSGLAEGLAATMLAEKANESMQSGKIVSILPEEYSSNFTVQ